MSAGGFNASDRQQVGPKDMQDGLFVPIHGFIEGTGKFPIQKCAIFCKFKEIKELRRGGWFCTPLKRFRRLTPKLRTRAIYGRKLFNLAEPRKTRNHT
jgi:hypothetical protein